MPVRGYFSMQGYRMTGDIATQVLDRLQELHVRLNKKTKAKHGQQEMDFGMFEYDDSEEGVGFEASYSPSSEESFYSENR